MAAYQLVVNGVARTVEAQPDTPLLWILRDTLNLPGTKYGCGRGLCGSCTIHFNGAPLRSCMLPVAAAEGAAITTIEGLSPGGLNPLQEAWCEHDVPQCGYCQAGQIMTAAALLRDRPDPTDAEIDEALAGNLCRCGTHVRIRAAVKAAALRLQQEASA
ncbi:MAG TPA: (2Fe-2S)-binding protein [Opitutaceae bacterium]|nr:(2Fe-2S)-binding protein [Opitutaceae bacterium]HRJ48421.1 (2Fe-2S)-binding protein [Opitutaceae bacterium]